MCGPPLSKRVVLCDFSWLAGTLVVMSCGHGAPHGGAALVGWPELSVQS